MSATATYTTARTHSLLLRAPPAPAKLSTPTPPPRLEALPSTSPRSPFTTPPPGALVFPGHVHRPPPPMSRSKRWKTAYEGHTAVVTLERWESWLVHLLLLSSLYLTYLFLRHVLPSTLAHIADKGAYYLFGGGAGRTAGAAGVVVEVGEKVVRVVGGGENATAALREGGKLVLRA
ncbi:hypothetical protein JCM8547_007199 [Rhodosporidiobolus lusitaniae]